MKSQKTLFLPLLLFGSMTISILLGEWFIRILLPVYDPSGMIRFRTDAQGTPLGIRDFVGRQWKNTGDFNVTIRINSIGFRDEKDIRSSKANDLFVVGDSFSFGMGIEENERYSNVLETLLRTHAYNISMPATDLNDYQKLIRYAIERGGTVKNLIIGVCMENDIKNYDRPQAPPNYVVQNHWKKLKSLKGWLTNHSALYNLIATFVHHNEMLRTAALKAGLLIDNYEGIGQSIFNDAALSSSAKKLLELARPYHSFILIIPSRRLWIGSNQKEENAVHNEFVRKLKELGLNVIDLKPIFEEDGRPLQYHFKNDGHWNREGHLKAAQVIAKYSR